jgi:hypothetical protein
MGVFRGHGNVLFGPAKFGVNFHLHNEKEIISLHQRLRRNLETLPHGPFHAISLVLGIDEAKHQATSNHECILPPCFAHEQSLGKSHEEERPRKRARIQQDVEREYIDVDVADEEDD